MDENWHNTEAIRGNQGTEDTAGKTGSQTAPSKLSGL